MNVNLKLLALLLILPLLTVVATHVPDASADKGDGKSCANKHKSADGSSYGKSFYKMGLNYKKQQI